MLLNWVQDNEEQIRSYVLQRFAGDKKQQLYGNIIVLESVKSTGQATAVICCKKCHFEQQFMLRLRKQIPKKYVSVNVPPLFRILKSRNA